MRNNAAPLVGRETSPKMSDQAGVDDLHEILAYQHCCLEDYMDRSIIKKCTLSADASIIR